MNTGKFAREANEGRGDFLNLRAPLDFVVLTHPGYAPLQFVKLSQRLDRAELIDVERGEGFERGLHASVGRSGFRFRLRVRRPL